MDFFAYQNVEFYRLKIKFYGCIITKEIGDFELGEYYDTLTLIIPTSTLQLIVSNKERNTWYTKSYKICGNGDLKLYKVV